MLFSSVWLGNLLSIIYEHLLNNLIVSNPNGICICQITSNALFQSLFCSIDPILISNFSIILIKITLLSTNFKTKISHFTFIFKSVNCHTYILSPNIFKIILLLFNYSCLHFLPPPPLHPIQTHFPPLVPPSLLVLSMCPLQQVLQTQHLKN